VKERGVAVFSGVETRVVDRLVRQLAANNVDSAFVEIRRRTYDEDYFQRLLAQTLVVLERVRARGDVPASAFLVSSLIDEDDLIREQNHFFPALRRVALNPEWRGNPDAAVRIQAAVLEHYRSGEEREFIRTVSAKREARFLLPIYNTRCKSLESLFLSVYSREAASLSKRVTREIVCLRKRKGYRVSGLDFAVAINNERHPVRRCSPTAKCDLEAAFRFGSPVPERLEFDVTCENGLRKKSFRQCDGSTASVNAEPTHINMRINGDFAIA
jgi:hypothetical protein